MQPHWRFICSRRLFLTFGNLTSTSANARTFEKTKTKSKKYESCFEQVFHLPYVTRSVKKTIVTKKLEISFSNFVFELIKLRAYKVSFKTERPEIFTENTLFD